MSVHYNIAIVYDDENVAPLSLPKHELYSVSYFTRINDCDADFKKMDIIILTTEDKSKVQQQLKSIRNSERVFLIPVFSTLACTKNICDGYYESVYSILNIADDLKSKQKNIVGIKQNWQAKSLAYFYTRDQHKQICADKNWQDVYLYHYPMMNLFKSDNEDDDIFLWLNELAHNQMIDPIKQVATYFCCNRCYSAHLIFSEHCPECKSTNIEVTNFIHCFSCGNIAPEQEFVNNGQLSCPQCHSKLKHIGVDYDRPLESSICQDCHHKFSETEIKVTCMICDHVSQTDTLAKLSIYDYKLTEKGKQYIRYDTDYTFNVFDEINYIQPEFFYTLIEWGAKMCHRDAAYHFSLIMIKIPNRVSPKQITYLAEKLRKTLRKTDMLTRISVRYIWIWLPNTPLKGAEVVKTLIEDKIDLVKGEQEFAITPYAFNELASVDNAKILLAELTEKVNE